jgi:hypothetical protein
VAASSTIQQATGLDLNEVSELAFFHNSWKVKSSMY